MCVQQPHALRNFIDSRPLVVDQLHTLTFVLANSKALYVNGLGLNILLAMYYEIWADQRGLNSQHDRLNTKRKSFAWVILIAQSQPMLSIYLHDSHDMRIRDISAMFFPWSLICVLPFYFAQAAGAKAAIVVNKLEEGQLITMGDDGSGSQPGILAVS
eukprot:scaffold145262_cov17-Prasinocladus_malaysianus.AAC.1